MDNKNSGVAFDFTLIKRIVKLARPYKAQFYGALALTLVLTLISPIRPRLVMIAIDDHIVNKDLDGLLFFSILILVHIVIQTGVMYAHTYISSLLGQNVIMDLRNRVYKHILSLNKKFFDESKVGTLVTRSISDIETISQIFSQGLISIIGDLAQLLAIVGFMFYLDWDLTLISLAVMPVLLVASEFFRRGVRKSFQQVRSQVSKLNAFVQEHIVGMEVVQIFGKQQQEYKKFKEINRGHLDAYKKSIFYYSIYFPIVEILSSVAIGLIIWWSAKGFGIDSSPGLIISFYMYINMMFRPIRMIADRFNTMQMGMVASERIFNLIDDNSKKEISGNYRSEVKGDISFKEVWFAYNDDDYVLKGVNFSVSQGQSLAIVGATGAGKSSIINLISKLYTIQKGQITVDNIDINEYDIHYLRNQISVVLQDVFLFAGTVKENVQLKEALITEDQMRQAAREIGALDFVDSLSEGWDYNVMERGTSLSVGQRQLISFIRALAFDPKILILDEATSSVDSETEELIQNATKKLMKDRTSIVIAHRLSTIREADQILVLDKGIIVEQGNHQELLDKEGYYHQLFQKQFELT